MAYLYQLIFFLFMLCGISSTLKGHLTQETYSLLDACLHSPFQGNSQAQSLKIARLSHVLWKGGHIHLLHAVKYAARDIRKNLCLKAFAGEDVRRLRKADYARGVFAWEKGDQTLATLNMLLQDARLFSRRALWTLVKIHRTPPKHLLALRPQIQQFIKKHAHAGDPQAQFAYGVLLISNAAPAMNKREGVSWIQKAGLGGACFFLSRYYTRQGQEGKALTSLKKGARLDHGKCLYSLAMHHKAKGDKVAYRKLLIRAVQKDVSHDRAKLDLARLYLKGKSQRPHLEALLLLARVGIYSRDPVLRDQAITYLRPFDRHIEGHKAQRPVQSTH
jgi:TPR repeat protein